MTLQIKGKGSVLKAVLAKAGEKYPCYGVRWLI